MNWITITEYNTEKKRTINTHHIVSYKPCSDGGTFIETTGEAIFATETTEQVQAMIQGDKQ